MALTSLDLAEAKWGRSTLLLSILLRQSHAGVLYHIGEEK